MSHNPPDLISDKKTNYRALLGEKAWCRLHPAIRKRFAENTYQQSVTYTGMMSDVYSSIAGRALAQFCRVVGTPLALHNGRNIPCKVEVYSNGKLQGMTWDRRYYFPGGKVNRVKSTKCISPESGLIEVVGCGFGMQLKIYEQDAALFFSSTEFFWQIGRFRIAIPDFLTPGHTIVSQRAIDDRNFEFTLNVNHPILGKVFYQAGVFKKEAHSSS